MKESDRLYNMQSLENWYRPDSTPLMQLTGLAAAVAMTEFRGAGFDPIENAAIQFYLENSKP